MEKNEILKELNEMGSPLAGMPRRMPYSVPDGYFDGMADAALRSARTGNVPAGYFEALPAAMLQAAKAAANASGTPAGVKKSTRVVAFPMLRWAAAAVLLVSLGTGAALLFNVERFPNPETVITALPQEDIAEYAAMSLDTLDPSSVADDALASTGASGARGLSNLSEAELEAYLTEEGLLF